MLTFTSPYQKVTEQYSPFKFVRFANEKHLEILKDDEYFAVMVEDSYNSENKRAKGKNENGSLLIGIERASETGFYISKTYSKRDGYHRGTSIIVQVSEEAKQKCYIL